MAQSEIPVDLTNPGQVFACLGFMEAADILLGGALAGFDWEGRQTDAHFRLAAEGEEPPVQRVLRFLAEAEVRSIAPAGSDNSTEDKKKGAVRTEFLEPGAPFPFPDPSSPATLPAVLYDRAGNEIAIDHWGDTTRRDNVKFWAGAGGYPGVALMRDALLLVRDAALQHVRDPFGLSETQSSSFRFDWRSNYIPIDAGFSRNKHKDIIMMKGFPLVEIFAAIGVTNARPEWVEKLCYRYGVLGGGDLLDPILVRAALGSMTSPVPGCFFRRFEMHLAHSGKDDRCITDVTEITQPRSGQEGEREA